MHNAPRKAILIAGMHRSGTSALTRVLNLLGLAVGDHLLPPRADNPSGYWEDESVVSSNDELLNAFGLSWCDPWPLPKQWNDSPTVRDWREELRHLLEDHMGNSPLFAVKDPRISRLLPAWKEVLAEMQITPHVLVCIRHPLEVASSLKERAGMPHELALALWLAYTVDAERASRDMARHFVRYDLLLDDWIRVTKEIQDEIRLTWPRAQSEVAEQVEAFLDPGLRHHHPKATIDTTTTGIELLAEEAYALAVQATSGASSNDSWNDVANTLAHYLPKVRQNVPAWDPGNTEAGNSYIQEKLIADLWMPADMLADSIESRLYHRNSGAEAVETAYVAAIVPTHKHPLRAEFELSAPEHVDFVRFDPASMPGVYRLHGIRLNGRPMPVEELRVTAVRERRLATRHDELLRFYCSDQDPYFELDIRGLQPRTGPLRIEFLFDRDSPLEEIDRHLVDVHHQLDDRTTSMSEQLAAAANVQSKLESLMGSIERQGQALERRTTAQIRFELHTSGHGIMPRHDMPTSRTSILRSTSLPVLEVSQLRLLANLPGSKGSWWSSDGGDPTMLLALPRCGLAAGWYVLSMEFAALDGQDGLPSLYVDRGNGFDEQNRIELAISHTTTRQRLLLRFDEPILAMRFDPRNDPGEFLISPIQLRQISRVEALARLSVPAAQRMRDQGAAWSQVLREMLASLAKGPNQALNTLHINTLIAEGTYAGTSYPDWIAQNDTLTNSHCQAMRLQIEAMSNPPLISILLPVYNTPAELLRECIESVRSQIYGRWELCIANDASTEPHIRELLDSATSDPRIKVVHRGSNGHISAASNSALELATGEWVALLDHDDVLPKHALFHVVETIGSNPDAQLIYSDEDKIDESGSRFDPYFKPDWNPELFLCQNFISHLGTYRTQLVRQVGGFREGFEGSQDHDLALRFIEHIDAKNIVHIPKVLYHWRAVSGSTAKTNKEKGYIHDAGLAAIDEHLARQGQSGARVSVTDAGYYRVRFPLPDPAPKVSLIIPTRDRIDLLRISVGSVLELTDYPDYEILIVDNGSTDPETIDWLARTSQHEPRVRVIRDEQPFNFSRLNNAAIEVAKGSIVGLVNNDIEVIHASWLSEMVSHAAREGVGAVGAKLYYPDDTIQHAGVILGFGGVAGHAYLNKPRDYHGQMGRAKLVQNLSAVTAACMIVKKSAYFEAKGMNEDLEVAFNDIDFCLRLLKAGYRNIWTPYAELIHHESASRGYEDTPDKEARFASEVGRMKEIWGEALSRDPAYNPNLSIDGEPYTLSWIIGSP